MKIDHRYEDSYPNPQSQVDIFSSSWSFELPKLDDIDSGGWAKTFVDPKIYFLQHFLFLLSNWIEIKAILVYGKCFVRVRI